MNDDWERPRRGSETTWTSLPTILTRVWWVPVAFVVTVLLLLLGAPIVVSRRVAAVRHDTVEVADEARVLVNELLTAYVARMYVDDSATSYPAAEADSISSASVDVVRRNERALEPLVRRIGPSAVTKLAVLRSRSREWHHLLPAPGLTAARTRSDRSVPGLDLALLSAAQSLEQELATVSERGREQVRSYERLDLAVASILTPLAIMAMLMVLWTGWRILALAGAIERERTALERSIEARTSLISGVTHDVKNPLGAAMGYAKLLEDGVIGTVEREQTRMIRRIRSLIDIALRTIPELLDVARADGGTLQLVMTSVSIGPMLVEVVEDYDAMAKEKQIALRAPDGADPLLATTDAIRVRRIVSNLVSNAVKYTPRGGHVNVTACLDRNGAGDQKADRESVEQIAITVSDDGPGVPAELRDRIFDEFYRAPGAEQAASGHGIGLAVSRRFARALGGEIRVGDSPLGGAAFTVILPVCARQRG